MKNDKKISNTQTRAKHTIDKKLDTITNVKTTSNKLEELKTMTFQFSI
jgi:hypothetical protein